MAFLFFDASKSDILSPNSIGSEHLKPVLDALVRESEGLEELKVKVLTPWRLGAYWLSQIKAYLAVLGVLGIQLASVVDK